MAIKIIHIEGYILRSYDDGICIADFKDHRYGSLLSSLIAETVEGNFPRSTHQTEEYAEDYWQQDQSVTVPNVFFRFYSSDKKISLEDVQLNHLQQTLGLNGALDILTENYGYSEYTIMGCSTVNFTVGNHDLEKIFKSYINKYVHILIEYKDGDTHQK